MANEATRTSLEHRLRQLREENEELIRNFQEAINEQRRRRNEEVQKMCEHHEVELKRVEAENKGDLEKMKCVHREKLSSMAKSHEAEIEKCQENLEKIKKEGDEKIEKVSLEIEKCNKLRGAELEKFELEMEEAMSSLKEIVVKGAQQRQELADAAFQQKVEHLKIEHDTLIDHMDNKIVQISSEYIRNATKRVQMEFLKMLNNVREVRNDLRQICVHCGEDASTADLESMSYEIEQCLDRIKRSADTFKNRQHSFRNCLLNAPNAHAGVKRLCSDYLEQLREFMNGVELMRMTRGLQSAIDQQNMDKIAEFGETAEAMSEFLRKLDNEFSLKALQIPTDQEKALNN